MSKKNKSSQFPKSSNAQKSSQKTHLNTDKKLSDSSPANPPVNSVRVKPEELSLLAHQHIKQYLETVKKAQMEKEDLNAVLRLSQHLRLFGLLSAVAYINQQNAQEGKVRERTVPVWGSLLSQMLGKEIDTSKVDERKQLMESVLTMADRSPTEYMANWRKSMVLAEQWNFWARAYLKVSDV